MKATHLGAALVAAILLAACAAGVNFTRPPDDALVLGSTTRAQIIALMGEPNGKGQKVSNGENLDVIGYAYALAGGEAVFEDVTPARSVAFIFHGDVLVGKEWSSSFKADSSFFDPEKARSVKKGMTAAAVLALLGRPGGEYRYPLISSRGSKALVYSFAQTKGFKSQQSLLVVELDEKGVVQKSEFTQVGQL